jgi:hypothetical protein
MVRKRIRLHMTLQQPRHECAAKTILQHSAVAGHAIADSSEGHPRELSAGGAHFVVCALMNACCYQTPPTEDDWGLHDWATAPPWVMPARLADHIMIRCMLSFKPALCFAEFCYVCPSWQFNSVAGSNCLNCTAPNTQPNATRTGCSCKPG